ncbi:PREDICTED: uncharacterized protein LOC109147584 isoform X2 [Ipomoea nil]|uniref:uncharacterized protein LOC109147584 isoform X2 n=1 Tax=Ipomoea nil TaxID=35883 RepID=UPI000901D15B|nr:PREDICTED: uncharacterized protein LOC109147584 isoform X2 [Ipomoea nil]
MNTTGNININISIPPSSPRLPNSLIPHNTSHAPPQYFKKKSSNGSFQLLSTTSKLSAIQCSQSSSSGGGWAEFANKVSGEWDGFGADFTEQGKPMELPECVVPEAYREWEVKVFDWQTQCPTLAHHSNFSFDYKLIRLLPTVGCEADAATRYSVDHRTITTPSSCTAFAYHPTTGCYVAAWAASTLELELEHCLIDPRDKESRVRIIQVLRCLLRLRGDDDDSNPTPTPTPTPVLELQTVKVFREQWYGPFRDGDQLGGCAIRDSAFASTPPLDASQIIGVWEGPIATATFLNSPSPPPKNVIPQQLNHCSTMVTVRDEAPNLVLLPNQLWCCLKDTEISGETCCEAGWLLDKGSLITSNCIFSKTGDLKQVAIAYQHATQPQ